MQRQGWYFRGKADLECIPKFRGKKMMRLAGLRAVTQDLSFQENQEEKKLDISDFFSGSGDPDPRGLARTSTWSHE